MHPSTTFCAAMRKRILKPTTFKRRLQLSRPTLVPSPSNTRYPKNDRDSAVKGLQHRLLRIDLSSDRHSYEELPDEVLRCSLGGKGLGVHLLMEENPAGIDPFSPDSAFLIAARPITGTKLWSQSRFVLFAKSAATGGYGESYCGDTLAPKIKGYGVDAIAITGACKNLSFLTINESGITLHDAANLEGRDTFRSEDYILSHAPDNAGAMVIGPAGENLVRFACIKSDRWRSLGRGGMGAVMRAKNLKGIAFSGSRPCAIADERCSKTSQKPSPKKDGKRRSRGYIAYWARLCRWPW